VKTLIMLMLFLEQARGQ